MPMTAINLATIGHAGHGKTTLAAALARRIGGHESSYVQIDNAPEEVTNGASFHASHVNFETSQRHYALVDCPLDTDCVKYLISNGSQADAAILVVSAADGPMPETSRQICLASQVGIPYIIVFVNKADLVDDEELLELVEMEIRELLSQYDFPGDDTPIVRGSALKALDGDVESEERVMQLINELDTYISGAVRAIDKPFLLPIEKVVSHLFGTTVSGTVQQGIVRLDDAVEVVGAKTPVRVMGIEKSLIPLVEAHAGENVGIVLSDIQRGDIEIGQLLVKPSTVKTYTKFTAVVYMLLEEEGGRSTPFDAGYRPDFYFFTTGVAGSVELPDGEETVAPGDNVTLTVTLGKPVGMDDRFRFTIHEEEHTVGFGIVFKLID